MEVGQEMPSQELTESRCPGGLARCTVDRLGWIPGGGPVRRGAQRRCFRGKKRELQVELPLTLHAFAQTSLIRPPPTNKPKQRGGLPQLFRRASRRELFMHFSLRRGLVPGGLDLKAYLAMHAKVRRCKVSVPLAS